MIPMAQAHPAEWARMMLSIRPNDRRANVAETEGLLLAGEQPLEDEPADLVGLDNWSVIGRAL
jgi:hypothetical protein